MHGFSDADWAGNPHDRTSTTTFLIFLGANPISYSSTKQRIIAWFSTKAEYRVIAIAAAKLQLVKSLRSKLLVLVQSLPTLFSDNFGATYIFANPVFHSHMKHLAIDYHFVCYLVQSSKLCVAHVSTGDQLADALTKSLSRPRLPSLCNKIGVVSDTPS